MQALARIIHQRRRGESPVESKNKRGGVGSRDVPEDEISAPVVTDWSSTPDQCPRTIKPPTHHTTGEASTLLGSVWRAHGSWLRRLALLFAVLGSPHELAQRG